MRAQKIAVRSSSFSASTTSTSPKGFSARPSTRPSLLKKREQGAPSSKPTEPVNFVVGQKVVYPGYGVGQIQVIETKEVAGRKISFYMIRILESDVTVMVPLDKVEKVGLRPTVSGKQVEDVYSMLRDKKIVVEQTTWNRRHREYMEKIKTGCVFEIGEVVRDLCVLRQDKVLSFGERKMLELAKGLLVKELAVGEATDEPTIEAQIEVIFEKKAS